MRKGRLRIFFSGIGGSGVSALAGFLFERGHRVAGSDRAFDNDPAHPVRASLLDMGIKIHPQDGSGIDAATDLVVFSTAVEGDQPDILRAKALGVPLMSRPVYLAGLVGEFDTVAVAGTSGKSTAAGLLAFLMKGLGMEPNFIGGGRVKNLMKSGARNYLAGLSGELVAEACESDGTIVNYTPRHCLILNLELDHHAIAESARLFESLARNTSEKVIVNADCKNLKALKGLGKNKKNPVGFSLADDPGARYRGRDVALQPFCSEFSVDGVRFRLPLAGRHNVYNALGVVSVLSEMDVSLQRIADIMPGFAGIERRFDVHLNDSRGLVIDDYAHNPHKIRALMQAVGRVRENEGVCYIFQPHGYGPVRLMMREYIEAFADNLRPGDSLLLLPIFYAGGTTQKDVSSEEIARGVRDKGKAAQAVGGRDEMLGMLSKWKNYIVFGARDESLSAFAARIAQGLRA